MTRKDYIKLAKIFHNDIIDLKGSSLRAGYVIAIATVTKYLAEQNPAFDTEKFESAVFYTYKKQEQEDWQESVIEDKLQRRMSDES